MTDQQKAPQEQGVVVSIAFERSKALDLAFSSLEHLIKTRPDVGKALFNLLDLGVQIIRLDVQNGSASSTGQVRVLAEPSNFFLEFMSAFGA